MIKDDFTVRHIGPRGAEIEKMLHTCGVKTLDELIEKTVPATIRLSEALSLPEGLPEGEYLQAVKATLSKNKLYKSNIGMGYYNTFTPAVIMRNIFENPGWYTSYTPYQAEISQGRLEALLNYQTMIMELTAMPIANASLLDEASAAGEMMLMFYNSRSRDAVKNNVNKFFVSEGVFPQTLGVLKTNAAPLGID
ncbi:MAG: glycine dehydrogenase (aminomethyl-transferring), partial [Chitinophagaceae bacterium]|nr:glycine dehydrogenase (aminomethyl-transferring) [Chitinophagaceae bacterium]